MPSRSRTGRPAADGRRRTGGRAAVAGLLIGALAVVAGACSVGAPDALTRAESAESARPGSTVARAVPARIGEFVTQCPFSHRSSDDPLVHPHHDGLSVGSAHSHDFFGNTSTDEHSTPASLLASGATTCDLSEDLSSYWAPTLSRAGVPIDVAQFAAYYDTAPGIDPATVAPLPPGLSMIAGNDPRPGEATNHVGWVCGRIREARPDIPSCRFRAPLTLRLVFPDCWNGHDVDSPDHRGHVTYSTAGSCPTTHPVAIVRLVLRVQYPVYGDPADLLLSSGPLSTAHADFINAWTEQGQTGFVDLCIRRRVVCGVA